MNLAPLRGADVSFSHRGSTLRFDPRLTSATPSGCAAERHLFHDESQGREVRRTAGSFLYLGQRVSGAGIAPTRATLQRFQRKVAAGLLHPDAARVRRSIASYRGILQLVTASDTERQF